MAPLPPKPASDNHNPWPTTPGQLGLTVGVPFFDDDVLHGDLTVDVRYGRKFWWLVPYLSGGFRQARMDPVLVPKEAEKKKLLAWHATLGVRLEIPATKTIVSLPRHRGRVSLLGVHSGFDSILSRVPSTLTLGVVTNPSIGKQDAR